MTTPDDRHREELKPTCEGMVSGMPGPIDDEDEDNQDDINGEDTSAREEGAQ